ncbi:unnamed protein product [Cuscuta campestris]|uniref:Retrotransposon Copia-like N-terminal domain-containing protein n=1 Tax=Cuscuta campestris TaxID=132261 RepID=A0A484M0A7_9ASTE|nr:unnamed protein product [Cuscuta campestris]
MANNNNPFNLRYVLEKEKLSGTNFLDWEMNLKIVLECEKKLYVLTSEPPKAPEANVCAAEITSYKKYEDDARDVKCIIMASMTAELQRLHADMEVRPMIQCLRDLYQGQPQNSGIYVIEVNMSDIPSWVMDTGCGSHICTSMQNLHECRQLTEGEIQLKVGNGALVYALAVGTYSLSLPSGLILHLNNCLFVPSMSRNIISVSCLDKAGFSFVVKDKTLSVFRNDIFYATAHTLNRVPSKAVESTPYELWLGRKPSFSYFKIWGCEAYVKRLMTSSKLGPKSDKVIFVGYPKETRGYAFYHPSDNKIFVARNGTFLEKDFLSTITSGRKVDLEEIQEPQEEVPIVLEHEQRDQAIEPQIAQDIPSDPLTKPLGKLKHEGHTRSMGIRPMPDWP